MIRLPPRIHPADGIVPPFRLLAGHLLGGLGVDLKHDLLRVTEPDLASLVSIPVVAL